MKIDFINSAFPNHKISLFFFKQKNNWLKNISTFSKRSLILLKNITKSFLGCNCIIKISVPVYSQYCFPLARDGAISNYRIFLDIPNKILVSRPDKEEAVSSKSLKYISTPARSSRLPRRILKYLWEVKTSHLNHKDGFQETFRIFFFLFWMNLTQFKTFNKWIGKLEKSASHTNLKYSK